MKKTLKRLILVLVCLFTLSTTVFAVEPVSPQASQYISGSSAQIAITSDGRHAISFWITGTGMMTTIGAISIDLYEDDGQTAHLIKSYYYTDPDYSYIMGHNKVIHSAEVPFDATPGCTYYAYVHLKAGNSSGNHAIVQIAR